MDTALKETQTRFYALDMSHVGDDFKVDDGFNIKSLRVKEADKDGSLNGIASTYDPYDQVIRDGIYEGGRKVISFCGVLQQGIFPLPEILQMSQKYGSEEMRRPVEIEFACNLRSEKGKVNSDKFATAGDFYRLSPTSSACCVHRIPWDTASQKMWLMWSMSRQTMTLRQPIIPLLLTR